MAFHHSLRTAFILITASCLIFFLYQNGAPDAPISEPEDPLISLPAAFMQQHDVHYVPTQLQALTKAIGRPATGMFLTEPSILMSLQHEQHDQSSNLSSSNGTRDEAMPAVVNMGLIRTYHRHADVVKEMCVPLPKKQFRCSRIETDKIALLDRRVITHLVIESSRLKVHVAFFIKVRRHVLWVQQMQQQLPGSLFGANHSEVYDPIPIQAQEVRAGVVLSVPTDTGAFLRQAGTSRFISCEQQLAQNVTGAQDAASEAVQANTRHSVIQMKKLMTKLRVTFFLMSGTLLGWFRECGAIPYTTDADFATWARFATPQLEQQILSITHQDPSFRVYDIFGTFDMGYEMSFLLPNNFKSDLFFLYNETGNRVSSSGHVISERLYYKYFYPAFDVCSTIFLNIRVNVPCDPAAILSTEYGDWRTRVEDSAYSYRTSPRNRGPAIKYPSQMMPLYREFP